MRQFIRQLLVPPSPSGPTYSQFKFTFTSPHFAQFSFIDGNPGIGGMSALNGMGTNLFNGTFSSLSDGGSWTGASTNIYINSFHTDLPYSVSPTWLAVQLSVPVGPLSFYFTEYTGTPPTWMYTEGTVLIEGSNDGMSWTTLKSASGGDFVPIETVGGASSYYVNL